MITCEEIVKKLINKYNTRDPYEIATQLGIIVKFEHLSDNLPCGFFKKILKRKFIVINLDRLLTEDDIRNVLAHELGHAILHCNNDLCFLHEHNLCNRRVLEREADEFAAELLIDLDRIDYISDYTYFDIAGYFNVPPYLVKLKLNIPY